MASAATPSAWFSDFPHKPAPCHIVTVACQSVSNGRVKIPLKSQAIHGSGPQRIGGAFEKRELEFKAKEREERLMQLGSLRQAVAEAVTQPTVAPSGALPAAPAGEPRPSGGLQTQPAASWQAEKN